MKKETKTVRIDAIRPGDHIFSDKKSRLYFHHGIYVGDQMVSHLMGPSKTYNLRPCESCGFKPQAGIFKTCLDCFLNGHSLYHYEYDVSYLKLVVETAYRLLEDKSFGSYNFFLNNCEDFAVYCKTGMAMSNQTAGLFGFNLVGAVGYHATKGIHEAFTN
ncbi:hypothetical protein V6Z11_A08G250400 [Gossypium hirsutum]